MTLCSQVKAGLMGGKQLGYRFAEGSAYGDYEQSTAKKRTKRERFLSEMEAVVPGRRSSI
jgi:transposase, IS5 family